MNENYLFFVDPSLPEDVKNSCKVAQRMLEKCRQWIPEDAKFRGTTHTGAFICSRIEERLTEYRSGERNKIVVTGYYDSKTSAIGETTQLGYRVNLAKKLAIQERVGNSVHEIMHLLGYTHSFFWTPWRKNTVPYAVGYMARDKSYNYIKEVL